MTNPEENEIDKSINALVAPIGELKKNGRPSIYSEELAKKICKRIAQGESLRRICFSDEMPNASTVHEWVLDDKEGFSKKYARARQMQAEDMFDEILEISDDGSNDYMTITKGNTEYNVEDREVTNRSRLRVDSRKWYLSKVLPKKFGEKVDVTSGGEPIKGNTLIFKDFNATDSQPEIQAPVPDGGE